MDYVGSVKRLLCLSIIALILFQSLCFSNEISYTFDDAKHMMATHCMFCHGENDPESALNLSRFIDTESLASDLSTWTEILKRVKSGEMPPKNALPIEDEKRVTFVNWLEQAIIQAACGEGISPGPAPIRRLNRDEYAATICDLLNIQFNAGHNLPADGAGGAGFDNASETLFLSPVHAERYLDAAKEVLDYAAKDNRARDALFIEWPDDETTDEQAANTVLKEFASRAFRRPVKSSEMKSLMALFKQAKLRGDSFEPAVFYAMQAVLISPHFLFLVESPNATGQILPINDYELASRLSYFLWGSMPDEELFELAEQQKLHETSTLRKQMERMFKKRRTEELERRKSKALEDRKFYEFANRFVSQWLGTRELGRDAKPDTKHFPRYNQQLQIAMKYEPVFVFQEIIDKDISLLHLLNTNFSYMNRQLARHYELHKEVKADKQQPVRVDLPKGSHRGGVMTMAGVLTVSSYPHRTSPVLRGKWVLETILGSPPPPPPPNVPELEEETDEEKPKTLRERLMAHRKNPACASCHDRIDPIGFAFENFDAVGRWRDQESGKPIDASGQLPNGQSFQNVDELKSLLMERKDDFIRHLTTKMLGYALGRGLVMEDQCTVNQIVETLKKNDYKAQVLIWEIINSVPFRYRPANEVQDKGKPPVQLWD